MSTLVKMFCFIRCAYFLYTKNEGKGRFRRFYPREQPTWYSNTMSIAWIQITHVNMHKMCRRAEKRNVVSNLRNCVSALKSTSELQCTTMLLESFKNYFLLSHRIIIHFKNQSNWSRQVRYLIHSGFLHLISIVKEKFSQRISVFHRTNSIIFHLAILFKWAVLIINVSFLTKKWKVIK